MIPRHPKTIFLMLSAACIPVHAQTAAFTPAPGPPPQQEIETLINQLGDINFPTRDAADKKLRALGWPVLSQLIIASSDTSDPEIKSRLPDIIECICFSPAHVTPESRVALQKYREASPAERQKMRPAADYVEVNFASRLVQFCRGQLSGVHDAGNTLRALDDTDIGTRRRRRLAEIGALDELEWDAVMAFLDSKSIYSNDLGPAAIVEITRRRGNPSQLAQALSAISKHGGQNSALTQLISLLQLPPAGLHAALLADPAASRPTSYLKICALADQRDWKAIGELPAEPEDANLFLRVTGYQFAGDRAKADALIDTNGPAFQKYHFWGGTPMLLGRMDLGQAGLKIGEYFDTVQLLIVQHRYAEAITVVNKAKAAHDPQAVGAEAELIAHYPRLNEHERARAIIKAIDQPPGTIDRWKISAKPECEALFSDDDLHLNFQRPPDLVYLFNRQRAPEVRLWLSVFKVEGPVKAFRNTARIINSLPAKDDLARLEKAFPSLTSDASEQVVTISSFPSLYALWILKKYGQSNLATSLIPVVLKQFESTHISAIAPSSRPADDLFGWPDPLENILSLHDWAFARPILQDLASGADADPVFTYLLGVCLERAGDPRAGEPLRIRSDDALIGDLPSRLLLARLLFAAGETELARHQAETVVEFSCGFTGQNNQLHELLAQICIEMRDYAEALQHLRWLVISRHHWALVGEDRSVYVRIPRQIAYCETQIALAEKKPAIALESAKSLISFDPENLDLTLPLIVAFKEARLDDQAASLATLNRNLLENILKDFPNSHLHHFLIARLDIQSGFPNDQTQAHLQKARQLAPDWPEYQNLK